VRLAADGIGLRPLVAGSDWPVSTWIDGAIVHQAGPDSRRSPRRARPDPAPCHDLRMHADRRTLPDGEQVDPAVEVFRMPAGQIRRQGTHVFHRLGNLERGPRG
jgi:hypothetical protein